MNPKMVENQCGSSDMIQSIDANVIVDDVATADRARSPRGTGAMSAGVTAISPRSCAADHAVQQTSDSRSRRRSRHGADDEERHVQVRRLHLEDVIAPRTASGPRPLVEPRQSEQDRHEQQRHERQVAARRLEHAPRRPGPTVRPTCAAASAARASRATGRGRTGSRSATTGRTDRGSATRRSHAGGEARGRPTMSARCCSRASAGTSVVITACVSIRSVLLRRRVSPVRRRRLAGPWSVAARDVGRGGVLAQLQRADVGDDAQRSRGAICAR